MLFEKTVEPLYKDYPKNQTNVVLERRDPGPRACLHGDMKGKVTEKVS